MGYGGVCLGREKDMYIQKMIQGTYLASAYVESQDQKYTSVVSDVQNNTLICERLTVSLVHNHDPLRHFKQVTSPV